MRTLRLSSAGLTTLALLGGVGAGAAEPTEPEVVWATIRDGVFADRAEWEARFEEMDPADEEQNQELRRLVRDQLALLEGLDLVDEDRGYRIRCLWEAHSAAQMATWELEGALTELLEGDRRLGEELFQLVQEVPYGGEDSTPLYSYWQLRDEVDCSTAGEVAAFLGSLELGGGSAFRPVTGRRLEYDFVPSEGSPRMVGNAFRVDGDTTYETWEWSDPLLPPDLTNRMNMANFSGEWDGLVIVASLLFEGPEGYWTGTGRGRTWVLTGQGAYEGLSAILTTTADTEADTLTVEGAIYAGPLPELPAPLEPGQAPAPERTEEPAVPPPTEDPALPTETPAFSE